MKEKQHNPRFFLFDLPWWKQETHWHCRNGPRVIWWQWLRNCGRMWTQPKMLLPFDQRMDSPLLQTDCCLKCLRAMAEQGQKHENCCRLRPPRKEAFFPLERNKLSSLNNSKRASGCTHLVLLVSHSWEVRPENWLTWVIMKVWTYICMHVGNSWPCRPGSFYWHFLGASGITWRPFNSAEWLLLRFYQEYRWI